MRGILRGHQFQKVEMVCFCKPEDSQKLHNEMVAVEELIWQGLGIPHHKLNVCS
jgi:seryl-tRNA synthetase